MNIIRCAKEDWKGHFTLIECKYDEPTLEQLREAIDSNKQYRVFSVTYLNKDNVPYDLRQPWHEFLYGPVEITFDHLLHKMENHSAFCMQKPEDVYPQF